MARDRFARPHHVCRQRAEQIVEPSAQPPERPRQTPRPRVRLGAPARFFGHRRADRLEGILAAAEPRVQVASDHDRVAGLPRFAEILRERDGFFAPVPARIEMQAHHAKRGPAPSRAPRRRRAAAGRTAARLRAGCREGTSPEWRCLGLRVPRRETHGRCASMARRARAARTAQPARRHPAPSVRIGWLAAAASDQGSAPAPRRRCERLPATATRRRTGRAPAAANRATQGKSPHHRCPRARSTLLRSATRERAVVTHRLSRTVVRRCRTSDRARPHRSAAPKSATRSRVIAGTIE
jgi:hypothetical protein